MMCAWQRSSFLFLTFFHAIRNVSSIVLVKTIEKGHVQLLCKVTEEQSGIIAFTSDNTIIAEVNYNGTHCVVSPDKLPEYLNCGCRVKSEAYCHLSFEAFKCSNWTCNVIYKYGLKSSEIETVCPIDVDCSKEMRWYIDGLNIETNDTSFHVNTYSIQNLSMMTQSFQIETPIAVCKVEENERDEWDNVTMYLFKLCSKGRSVSSSNTTCKQINGNAIVTIKKENKSSTCTLASLSTNDIKLTLCDALNRTDLYANRFVGNQKGLIKSAILVPASVQDFYVEGFLNHNIVTVSVTHEINLYCNGKGTPPSVMKLLKDGIEVCTSLNSTLRRGMQIGGFNNSGKYTCVALNALGGNNATIQVMYETENEYDTANTDYSQPTMVVVSVFVSVGVIAIAFTTCVCFVKRHRQCVSLAWCVRSLASGVNIELTDVNSDCITRTNQALFDGTMPDQQAQASDTDQSNVSSAELKEGTFAFDNETYSECIKMMGLNDNMLHRSVSDLNRASASGRNKCSKQDPNNFLEMGTIDLDPLYSGVSEPGPSFAISAHALAPKQSPHHEQQHLKSDCLNKHLTNKVKLPEKNTGSVVNEQKIPTASHFSTQKADEIVKSVAKQTKRPDDYIYSNVNTCKRTQADRKDNP